jgi:hypothetical protein
VNEGRLRVASDWRPLSFYSPTNGNLEEGRDHVFVTPRPSESHPISLSVGHLLSLESGETSNNSDAGGGSRGLGVRRILENQLDFSAPASHPPPDRAPTSQPHQRLAQAPGVRLAVWCVCGTRRANAMGPRLRTPAAPALGTAAGARSLVVN